MRALLESVPIFAGLGEAAIDLLVAEGHDIEYPDQGVIFAEGELESRAFLIQRGAVSITKTAADGHPRHLATLKETEFFGETCLLEMIPHTATATAQGPTLLYCIEGPTFYHLYKKMPDQYGILILNIARDLSRRLRNLDIQYCAHPAARSVDPAACQGT